MSQILGIVDIRNYTDYGSYELNKETVRYQTRVNSGIGAGNSGGVTAILTMEYTEWLESDPDREYTETFTLIPTVKLNNENIYHMMERMQWEGKKEAEKAIQKAKEEIVKDYIAYTLEISEIDKASKAWQMLMAAEEIVESAMSQGSSYT